MKKTSAPLNPVFEHQPDAVLNQDNPESGTKYEVLATTKRCRIISIAVVCTWTGQPTPLEIHVTIDGQSITHVQDDPVSAQYYVAELKEHGDQTFQAMGVTSHLNRAFLYEGRTVKVEAEITGGTVSNISARVKYAKIP